MTWLFQIKQFFVMFVVGTTLITCDSGSGGASGIFIGGTGSTTPNVLITSTNSQAIARDAYQALNPSDNFPLRASHDISPGAIKISSFPRLFRDIVLNHRVHLRSQLAARVDLCAVSGSMTTPDTATGIGAYFFNSCTLAAGITINGSVTVDGTGDINGASFSGSFTFNQFTISGSSVAQSLSTNGTIDLVWNTAAAIETGTISGNYTVTIGTRSIDVSGFSNSYTDNSVTGMTTDTINYTITSSTIGGRVTVTTTRPLITLDSEPNPRAGQLLINGGGGSTLRLTILGSGQSDGLVRLEVDSDGDGTSENPREISWATLNS